MQREIENKLAEELLSGWIQDGDSVQIGLADDKTGVTLEQIKNVKLIEA